MQICCSIPELNPGMDAYRVGTLLEMTRAIAITLAEQNLRVRVCVQGSMGSGKRFICVANTKITCLFSTFIQQEFLQQSQNNCRELPLCCKEWIGSPEREKIMRV